MHHQLRLAGMRAGPRSQLVPSSCPHPCPAPCTAGGLRRIILTASGGAFREWPVEKLKEVTVAQAITHPNWSMGKKITIDSATLMNKGLEVIEAHYLYGVDYDNIDIVIHPQSIIHSMVETADRWGGVGMMWCIRAWCSAVLAVLCAGAVRAWQHLCCS